MRAVLARRILLLSATMASLGWSQVPAISSLQSSPQGNPPANVTAITSGTPIQGFSLYINGTFHTANFVSVQWANQVTGATATFAPANAQVTATQIKVVIPTSMYAVPVASAQPVTITVQESGGSAASTFTVNPPLVLLGPILPSGTLNQPYSTNYTTGGTAPFLEGGITGGNPPPGITAPPPSVILSGTPTQIGVFNFQVVAVDAWGNSVSGAETIEVVDVPTLTLLSPNSASAGADTLTMTVTGNHFVGPVQVGPQQIPGSRVQWTVNGVTTALTTSFLNSTQVSATVPLALLATAGTPSVTVVQPGSATSNALPFSVIAPSIASISPVSVPAGSATVAMIVSGANFVVNASLSATSTVLMDGAVLITGFVNSGSLTAAVPSGLLTAPGSHSIQVINPGGSVSNIAAFQVLGPAITSLSPTSTAAGSPAFTLTVNGANYLSGSQVSFNGTALTTAFGSSTVLTATVPASLLITPGTYNVQVTNPGGAASNTSAFQVLGPTITSLSPTSTAAGSPAFALTVNGANYLSGSQVSFNGTALTTAFGGSTVLTATVPASLLTTPGTYNVQVTNPGGAASNTSAFQVLGPTITSLSPTSIAAGSPDFTLTVTGTNYVTGSQVSFRGTALAAAVGNGVTLTLTVPATLVAAAGTVNVQVVNPGGALSNVVTFTVVAPTLGSVAPTSVPVGSPSFTLAVTGANFVSGSVVWFGGTALSTQFGSPGSLSATVPSALVAATGPAGVQVINPGGAASNTLSVNVVAPSIASLAPASVAAGSAAFTLAVTGANFVPGSVVLFDGNALTTTFVNATLLNATVPAATVAGPRASSITVGNPGEAITLSAAVPFTVIASLTIVTTSLPSGTAGMGYSASLAGRAGTPPYTWAATGIPAGIYLNPATGVLSGTPQAAGNYVVAVVLRDAANSTATAQLPLTIVAPAPAPVSIAPTSNLPSGTVGVAYMGYVFANGGNGSDTFSLGSGSLPDGLTLNSSGIVSGTPRTPGQFSFTVVVTDSAGGTASGGFRITIQPAPLSLGGGPSGPLTAGTSISIAFTGAGGVPPYYCTPQTPRPPGTTFANCVLSGTPTTPGTYTLRITIADSTGAVVTNDVTITVVPPAQTLSLGGSLGDGKVGVPYSGQISATGGSGTYTYAGSGLPDGLSLSSSGSIGGTPATAGQFTLAATVTDSRGATASGSFGITIVPADLAITTASLPDGTVGVAYSAGLAASGGTPPYTWTVTGLPDGVTASGSAIGGTPRTPGRFAVSASVKDAKGTSAAKSFTVTIAPAALSITTASAPDGTAGVPYSTSFAASGGTSPYTFSATGLPAGLSISAAGTVSGTPTGPGAATIVVTVKDGAGASANRSYAVTIGLPAAPPLTFVGISDTSPPLQQPRVQVSLGNAYPVDVVVTLTLTFAADSGPDDPTIQFSSGGRTARITVPAGATTGATDVGVQTGSVAGLIAITAQMQATGQDVTPSPAPRRTIRIAPGAPVIVSGTVTAVRNSTGFSVTLTGYATDRELTQAIFQFTAAAGSNLQTTTVTVATDTVFAGYFSGAGATPFGSQFTYTQPFTVTGNTQAIASVTVTLVNKIGQSAAVTVTLN